MSVQILPASTNNSTRAGILIFIAVGLAIFAFDDSLFILVRRWIAEEEYSHGFLIPVVSAWLLWTRREALQASVGHPSWTGPAVILLAVFMHIIGVYSSIFILSHLGFILLLFGLVLAAGGYSLFKLTFIPIAFLIFAIPLPYFIESKLTLQLQLISSQLGVDLIQLFQIPVYLEGNIIDLGYYKLQVVEACSGLRYMYPLLSLSFLAAYLFQAPIWQRGLVFLSGVPITIFMNGFRIGLVGVTVNYWGTKMADGVLHVFEGWVIFIACAGILIGEIYALSQFSGRQFFHIFHLPSLTAKPLSENLSELTSQLPLVTCLILVAAAGLMAHSILQRSEFIPERTRFALFPTVIDEWQGHNSQLDDDAVRGLGLDDYLLSDYNKPNGAPVNFYVAYYSSQRNGYSPHSPSVCIPGGGWLITNLEQISYNDRGAELPLNRLIIERNGVRQLVYYWFDERGRKLASEYWAKWYLLLDAITKNRTDGALVRLTTEIAPSETERDADARLQSFMHIAVPRLAPYLPAGQGSEQHQPSGGNNDHG